jgi:hypothetical protein
MQDELNRALREAWENGQLSSGAGRDETLWERLAAVNEELPMPPRLNDAQNAALTQFLLDIAMQADGDDAVIMAMLMAMLSGFQLGHDYALKYGRLGEER